MLLKNRSPTPWYMLGLSCGAGVGSVRLKSLSSGHLPAAARTFCVMMGKPVTFSGSFSSLSNQAKVSLEVCCAEWGRGLKGPAWENVPGECMEHLQGHSYINVTPH